MACASDNISQNDQEKLEEHLKCPICFDLFRSPRALSCLHTFCEDCLSTHVEKCAVDGDIECPTCRQVTKISDSGKPKGEWYKQLPLNYTILPLLETLRNEQSGKVDTEESKCVSCMVNLKGLGGLSFCNFCQGTICISCTDLHKKLVVFEDHEVHDFGAEKASRKCDQHEGKALEFFCEVHKEPLCSTCAVSGHRTCEKVIELNETVLKEAIQVRADEISKRLLVTKETTSRMYYRIKEMKQRYFMITGKLSDEYEGANKKNEEMSHQQSLHIIKCYDLLRKIENMSRLLGACVQVKTKQCLVMVLQNITKEVRTFEEEMKELESVDISKWELGDIIDNFIEKVAPFGNVSAVQKPATDSKESAAAAANTDTCMSMETDTANKVNACDSANSDGCLETYAKDIKYKFVGSTSLQKGSKELAPWLKGMVYLREGLIVAIDNQNDELLLMNEDCEIEEKLLLQQCPVGIAKENESCVAVTFDGKQAAVIQLFYVAEPVSFAQCLYEVDEVRLENLPQSIACTSSGFTFPASGVVLNVDKSGHEIRAITFDFTDLNVRNCGIKNIIVNEAIDMMYITDQDTNTLTIMSYGTKNSKHFYVVRKLKTPAGLDYDIHNNVYVCCERDNCIVVFSPYGQEIMQMPMHSCRFPSTIAFNLQRNKFWVTNRDSPEVIKEIDITNYEF